MKGILLDADTLNHVDLDLSGINSHLTEFQVNKRTSADQLIAQIKNYQVVITTKVAISEEVLLLANDLRLICVAATGMNNIDLEAALDNNIVVCNVTNYANESVAQHVFGLIISLMRNFPAYKTALDKNEWHNSTVFSLLNYKIENLNEKTLGIIGYGELGKSVESIAKCFGMKVIIAERKDISKNKIRSGRVSFSWVIENADIISLHCPLTNETKNLITETHFNQMKSNCIIINTARGGIINEKALVTALNRGDIAAAGIDVLEQEPPTENSILLSKSVSNYTNLIITPHIAWASKQSRQKLINKVAENIQYFINDEYRDLKYFYYK